MARIILSYRRNDSAAIAGRIFDRLSNHYGEDAVFMDIDNIPFGIDFRDHIQTIMSEAGLVIAVIGPRWLGAGAGSGGRDRIADATDPVRVEIETALKRGTKIIPVLVDGAQMPDAEALPEAIRQLAFINAAPVDAARDFRAHMDRLIRSIDRIAPLPDKPVIPAPPPSRAPSPPARRRGGWLLAILLGAVLLAGGGIYLAMQMNAPPAAPPAVASAEKSPPVQPQAPPSSDGGTGPDANPPPQPDDTLPQLRPHTYWVIPTVSEGKLNMRSGPGSSYPLVAAIPATTTGLKVGVCTMPDDGGAKPWCEAEWSKQRGWVSSCCIVDEVTGQPPQ